MLPRPSSSALLLHEVIIRALQMVLNAWKKYVEDCRKAQEQPPE